MDPVRREVHGPGVSVFGSPGRMSDFGNFLNGFAKSPRLIVLNFDWVQFVFMKNREIPHSVRGLCVINSTGKFHLRFVGKNL